MKDNNKTENNFCWGSSHDCINNVTEFKYFFVSLQIERIIFLVTNYGPFKLVQFNFNFLGGKVGGKVGTKEQNGIE